jgi:hypothetical protein
MEIIENSSWIMRAFHACSVRRGCTDGGECRCGIHIDSDRRLPSGMIRDFRLISRISGELRACSSGPDANSEAAGHEITRAFSNSAASVQGFRRRKVVDEFRGAPGFVVGAGNFLARIDADRIKVALGRAS